MAKLLPPPFPVGTRVRYTGPRVTTRDNGTRFEKGSVGVVVEVRPPVRGLGMMEDLDGEEVEDKDQNGGSVVNFENWGKLYIRAEYSSDYEIVTK